MFVSVCVCGLNLFVLNFHLPPVFTSVHPRHPFVHVFIAYLRRLVPVLCVWWNVKPTHNPILIPSYLYIWWTHTNTVTRTKPNRTSYHHHHHHRSVISLFSPNHPISQRGISLVDRSIKGFSFSVSLRGQPPRANNPHHAFGFGPVTHKRTLCTKTTTTWKHSLFFLSISSAAREFNLLLNYFNVRFHFHLFLF